MKAVRLHVRYDLMKGMKIRMIDGAAVADGAAAPGPVFLVGFTVGMVCFVTTGVFATVVMDAMTRVMS